MRYARRIRRGWHATVQGVRGKIGGNNDRDTSEIWLGGAEKGLQLLVLRTLQKISVATACGEPQWLDFQTANESKKTALRPQSLSILHISCSLRVTSTRIPTTYHIILAAPDGSEHSGTEIRLVSLDKNA